MSGFPARYLKSGASFIPHCNRQAGGRAQRHHRNTPQKKRILKGCQRALRVCDNAPCVCWHPVGMHSDLRGFLRCRCAQPQANGFHASGMTGGCRSGSAINRRLYGARRRVHVRWIQGCRVGTPGERRRPNRWEGEPYSVPDTASNSQENLSQRLKVARSEFQESVGEIIATQASVPHSL